SNCFAGIMFDVQNFVSFTNSRLATKNFIDYVLLVQFSRFISLPFSQQQLLYNIMSQTLCQQLILFNLIVFQ
ncbi:hypothetical protein, partial [Lysinibacillus xylanilyticus]|uniref:hypothetical protein n=1 Tax=Lysinibacillus xylanilyticus TaxID=582475 RepID=UPI003D03F6C8